MTKITEQRELMLQHLKQLNKLSLKANIKHSTNVQKNLDHTVQITKFMKEDRAKISRLENVIDMKQREVDERHPAMKVGTVRIGIEDFPQILSDQPLQPKHHRT